MLKKVNYGGRVFNLLNQASEHRATVSKNQLKKLLKIITK